MTPWDGLRLGSLTPPPESTFDPHALHVKMGSRPLLRTNGLVAQGNVEPAPGLFVARTHAPQPVTITMACDGPWAFEVDGAPVEGARGAVDLPSGRHSLRVKTTAG